MKRSKLYKQLLQLTCWLCPALARARARLPPATILSALRVPRGGYEYELNPDYLLPPPEQRPDSMREGQVTLGDLELNQRRSHSPPSKQGVQLRLSTSEQLVAYATRLHKTSPMLTVGTISCVLVWLLWQRPQAHQWLQNHFVCSRHNIRQGRHYTTLLSAISHQSLTHLLVNLFTFLSIGPSVVQTLSKSNWPVWPLVVGSAMCASHANLLFGRSREGCMGLSGVTLALLAFEARCYPEQELRIALMGVIPIRMQARTMLYFLLVYEVIGSIRRKGKVAHSAHLGGLFFGTCYYELWMQRDMLKQLRSTPMVFLRREWRRLCLGRC